MNHANLFIKRLDDNVWSLSWEGNELLLSDKVARNMSEYILSGFKRQDVFRAASPDLPESDVSKAAKAVTNSNRG